MARILTYLAAGSLALAATLAGCGDDGGEEEPETGGTGGLNVNGNGNGPGTVGAGVEVRSLPPGFTQDDGSGTPTYKDAELDASVYETFSSVATSPPSPSLDLRYPFPETMVPPNLTFIDFQWLGEPGHDKALVLVTASTATYRMYLKLDCEANGACVRQLPSVEFQNLGKNHPGEDVSFQIITTQDGSEFASTEPLTIRYSPERLNGALYYWASASRAIRRVAFGADKAADFIIPGTNVDYACVSCHSVSRDGSTIAFGVSPEHGENIAAIQVASTADPGNPLIEPTKGTTPFGPAVYDGKGANPDRIGPVDSLGHNVALNPDGSFMAVNATEPPENWPTHLDIRATNAADATVASYELGAPIFGPNKIGIHPEYSPDGSKLVVTLAENKGALSAWANEAGSIAVLPVNADGTLGNAQVVATPEAGAYHFYPTWSPDGRYVAFMTSWSASSLGNEHAVIHMVGSTGSTTCPGSDCIELARGTGFTGAEAKSKSNDFLSTWPKFAPFAQGSVYFITFSSQRSYGLFPGQRTQLWMFGVDTATSGDPSYSPFWLPYQDRQDGSLTPYWTEGLPCTSDGVSCEGCQPSETCVVNEDFSECSCEVRTVR